MAKAVSKNKKIKKGNDVKWTSQSNGVYLHKRGEVVAVIPPGQVPADGEYKGLFGCGGARAYESYVVFVKKQNRHYWPYPDMLRKA